MLSWESFASCSGSKIAGIIRGGKVRVPVSCGGTGKLHPNRLDHWPGWVEWIGLQK
jgi:hypothetical protein